MADGGTKCFAHCQPLNITARFLSLFCVFTPRRLRNRQKVNWPLCVSPFSHSSPRRLNSQPTSCPLLLSFLLLLLLLLLCLGPIMSFLPPSLELSKTKVMRERKRSVAAAGRPRRGGGGNFPLGAIPSSCSSSLLPSVPPSLPPFLPNPLFTFSLFLCTDDAVPREADVGLRVPRRVLEPLLLGRPQSRQPQRGALGHADAAEARPRPVLHLPRVGRQRRRPRAAAPATRHGRKKRTGMHLFWRR